MSLIERYIVVRIKRGDDYASFTVPIDTAIYAVTLPVLPPEIKDPTYLRVRAEYTDPREWWDFEADLRILHAEALRARGPLSSKTPIMVGSGKEVAFFLEDGQNHRVPAPFDLYFYTYGRSLQREKR